MRLFSSIPIDAAQYVAGYTLLWWTFGCSCYHTSDTLAGKQGEVAYNNFFGSLFFGSLFTTI
jgi:hypothetical protein